MIKVVLLVKVDSKYGKNSYEFYLGVFGAIYPRGKRCLIFAICYCDQCAPL